MVGINKIRKNKEAWSVSPFQVEPVDKHRQTKGKWLSAWFIYYINCRRSFLGGKTKWTNLNGTP